MIQDGNTALMLASMFDISDIVNLILSSDIKADVNIINNVSI